MNCQNVISLSSFYIKQHFFSLLFKFSSFFDKNENNKKFNNCKSFLMAITRFFWAWIGQNKEMLFLCLLFKKSSNILSFKFLLFFGKNENNKNSKITSHRWCLLEAFGAWIVKKKVFPAGMNFLCRLFYMKQLFSPCHSNCFLL